MRSVNPLLLLLCAATLLTACHTRVDPVATRDQRVTDPDYVPFFRTFGERQLADAEYEAAWREYALLGDFSSLRQVITAYAADVERFDPVLYNSMIEEYGDGYHLQFNDERPLVHLGPAISKASDEQLGGAGGAADPRRARIAWELRYRYLVNLRMVDDRAKYLPQLLTLREKVAGMPALAADIDAAIEQLRADHMGQLGA